MHTAMVASGAPVPNRATYASAGDHTAGGRVLVSHVYGSMCGRMECGSSSGQGMHASILGATQNQWIAETEGGDGYGGDLVAARAVSTRGVVVAVDQPEPVVRDVATACKCDVLCSLFFSGRCLILLLNSVYRNCLRSSAKQDLIRTLDRLIKSRNEEHGTTSSKVRFFIYKERKKLRLHPPSAFSA